MTSVLTSATAQQIRFRRTGYCPAQDSPDYQTDYLSLLNAAPRPKLFLACGSRMYTERIHIDRDFRTSMVH